LLKAYSAIGKELDSLADMVSFGVLPSVILYQLFLQAPQIDGVSQYLNYMAFLIPVFSALRLANFNIDTRQTEIFIGLPTPANAFLIASLPLILRQHGNFYSNYILNPFFLSCFVLISCMLLVAELPLLSLKFKGTDMKENIYRYLLIAIAAIMLLIFKFAAIPMVIFIYIAISIFQFKFAK
jgi:CDP-diacylglycerol--serine O-phosphatidyltransferase